MYWEPEDKSVQSHGNSVPSGQDLVTSRLDFRGHGRLLCKMDNFLLLHISELGFKVRFSFRKEPGHIPRHGSDQRRVNQREAMADWSLPMADMFQFCELSKYTWGAQVAQLETAPEV